MLEITIPMKPVAKGRPRFSQGRCFTPEKTVIAEGMIARAVYRHMLAMNIPIAQGPLSLNLSFFFKLPKKSSDKQTLILNYSTQHHIKRPDIDNLEKLVTDSLNKVAYYDDCQIAQISARKLYAEEDSIHILLKNI